MSALTDTERNEIEHHLAEVIHPDDFESWWDLPIPALGGLSARETVARGQKQKVVEYVRTYSERPYFT